MHETLGHRTVRRHAAITVVALLGSACAGPATTPGPPPPGPAPGGRGSAGGPTNAARPGVAIDAGVDAGVDIPPGIVDVHAVDPTIRVELVYAGSDNFLGRPADGYHANVCYLTEQAAQALARAQARVARRAVAAGSTYSLLVRDCYRPRRAVADFVRWAAQPEDPVIRARHHPGHARGELLALGYIAPVSGHSRASTVDLTIVELGAGGTVTPLTMGTEIDFFGARAHTAFRGVAASERAHRQLLLDVMTPDFTNFAKEWWHFTLTAEPSQRSHDFEIR